MHSAYTLSTLLKLPQVIQSMAGFADFLLIGTQQGHLLMYAVRFKEPPPGGTPQDETTAPDVTIQLLKSNTDYRKPIMQMEIKEIGTGQYILVVLSDGMVSVHYISCQSEDGDTSASVPTLSAATKLPHPKVATAFALDVVRPKTLTGEQMAVIRIAVAVRKRLQFFYWKKEKFLELHQEVSIPYEALSMAWCKDSVFVAFVGGYSLIKLNRSRDSDDGICELFSAGERNSGVTLLADERFALIEDKSVKLVDLEGNSKSGVSPITWTDPPTSLAHDPPYLIGLLKRSIEIRSDTPSILIQNLDIHDAKLVCVVKSGLAFVASGSQVWFIKMISTSSQVKQLVIDKQFELAIRLCTLTPASNVQVRSEAIREIQTLFAFDQFCSGKFREAMDVFVKLDIDPSHVIGLYTDLLPPEFCNQIKYPSKVPSLEELGRENAILALIEFLTQVRHRLKGLNTKRITSTTPMIEGPVIDSKNKLMEIIDTTLLKCYVSTNSDTLVASLVRLKENQCHLEESERTLKKNGKLSELIILFNTRGLHRKALTLLMEHQALPDSPLKSPSKMIDYLQNLSEEHIDLVCEFASNIFEVSEKDGLRLFTDDLLEVECWPRSKVLVYLQMNQKSVVVSYLEHIITVWEEKGPVFHNTLLLAYKDAIVEYLEQPPDEDIEYKLEVTRGKLKNLLTLLPTYYTAETVLTHFPTHCLYEERAILLGSLGRHMEALAIYLYQVRSVEEALEYCQRHAQNSATSATSAGSVWTSLFKMLVQPLDGPMLRAMNLPKNLQVNGPDIENALSLLKDHGSEIDMLTVLVSMPTSVELKTLAPYFESAMEKRVSKRHDIQLLRGLLHSQYIQVQEERISAESQKIVLTEVDACHVCLKKFRSSATFVRFPNGRVVHFSCQERSMMIS